MVVGGGKWVGQGVYTPCYLLEKLNSLTLYPKLILRKRLLKEMWKLPWTVGGDIGLEIDLGQERRLERLSDSPTPWLGGAFLLAVLFPAGSLLSF